MFWLVGVAAFTEVRAATLQAKFVAKIAFFA
jgi:hypothetical protein